MINLIVKIKKSTFLKKLGLKPSVPGEKGKDADEEKIVQDVLSKIPTPENIILDGPDEIRNKLELLLGDERLDMSAIRGLKEALEEVGKSMGGKGVPGDASVAFSISRLTKTETPSGLINGSNKTYELTGKPKIVLGFWINGMFIHDDEYSISGVTITFTAALPASLSSTGFTIKYV